MPQDSGPRLSLVSGHACYMQLPIRFTCFHITFTRVEYLRMRDTQGCSHQPIARCCCHVTVDDLRHFRIRKCNFQLLKHTVHCNFEIHNVMCPTDVGCSYIDMSQLACYYFYFYSLLSTLTPTVALNSL